MPSNVRSVSRPANTADGQPASSDGKGIIGQSIGMQTYLVNIDHDQIGEREQVDNHWCAQETFEAPDAEERGAGPACSYRSKGSVGYPQTSL
jgi:hypothetical protein